MPLVGLGQLGIHPVRESLQVGLQHVRIIAASDRLPELKVQQLVLTGIDLDRGYSRYFLLGQSKDEIPTGKIIVIDLAELRRLANMPGDLLLEVQTKLSTTDITVAVQVSFTQHQSIDKCRRESTLGRDRVLGTPCRDELAYGKT